MNRRHFISILGAFTVLGISGDYLYNKFFANGPGKYIFGNEAVRNVKNSFDELLGDDNVKYLRQIVTANNQGTRRITWQSASPLPSPKIEYRSAKKSTESYIANTEDISFNYGDVSIVQYTALLEGLNADTEYEFRIISESGNSEWHKLQTAPDKGDFKMIIFPDSQSSDYSDFEKVAQGAWERNSDAKLFTVMGDLVDNGQDHSQWRAWFNALDGIIGNIAFAPVMGNHETYDLNWQTRLPAAYLGYFQHPDNGSEKYNQYYYSFDYGDVHFSVLNTQDYELGDFADTLVSEQKNWLRRDMNATKKKWKIVLMHRDVLMYAFGPQSGRSGRPEGFDDDGVNYMPLFDELGIDIVFTAHLHTYRNRGHIYNFDHSSKGPLYILTGVAGNVRYPHLWKDHTLDIATLPQPETDNYLTMEVTDKQLTVKCFLPDGTQMDEASVTK